MATLLPNGTQQFIDANGRPLVGGSVAFYVPNTTMPKDTWQDAGGTILNTNPVILNSSGEAVIYGSGTYRQVVKDALGNLIWDQLTSDTAVGGLLFGGTSTGTPNAQIIAVSGFTEQDGQQIAFIAGLTNTGATTIAPGDLPGIAVLKNTNNGPAALTGGEIVTGNAYNLIYDASRGAFHISAADNAIGDLWAETFGLSPSNSAADNSDAFDAALSAAAAENRLVRVGGGAFNMARNHVIPHGIKVICSGNNAENGPAYYGPTVFYRDFVGSYQFTLSDSAEISLCDIVGVTGKAGGGINWSGARAIPRSISCFNLNGTAFSMEDPTKNMNLWASYDCRAVDCVNGLVVAQFRPAQAYANGITLVLNAEYYDTLNGVNYAVTAAGAGNVTASGTLAADLVANPTWWVVATFPYGAPDTNGGTLVNFEASRCTGAGVKMQNTNDNSVFGGVIQNCGTGISYDYASSGNRLFGYIEASSGDDIYFGITVSANEVFGSALVPPVVNDQSGGNNVWYQKVADGSGAVRYVASNLSLWNPGAETRMDLFNGANFIKSASVVATNPSGSIGRLELWAKPSGVAQRRFTTLYPEARMDMFGDAANNTFHAFYDNGVVQRGSISNTGATTTYATSSDQTFKIDDGEITVEQAIEIVRLMKLHDFHWRPEHGGYSDQGVFAQELFEVYPRAVKVGYYRDQDTNLIWSLGAAAEMPDDIVEKLEYVPWQVDYSKLIVPLARALQGSLVLLDKASEEMQGMQERQDSVEGRLAAIESKPSSHTTNQQDRV